MAKWQEIINIYMVLLLLGVGVYMGILQKQTFEQVEHLKREAKFSKIIGYIYIALSIAGVVFLFVQ